MKKFEIYYLFDFLVSFYMLDHRNVNMYVFLGALKTT